MQKILGILFALIFGAFSLAAQLPAGSTAPDFTAQDINGQTHHLYDILESGKIVILEISATWCAPCWVYHTSQALQDLYAAHGPSGDDKLRILWIEGDPSTNINCIYGPAGCNGGSVGDYTQGVEYPIIDNAAIANAYQITYFPSLFVICPNKRLFEVDPLSAEDLWEKANVCPVAYGTNNAGIFAFDPGTQLNELCGVQEIQPNFQLTNLGAAPLTQATIELLWNNNVVQTLQWSGQLSTYGEAGIVFDPISVNNSGTLQTTVSSINNAAIEDDFSNNEREDNFAQAKQFNTTDVVLKIKTDSYGEETYWEVRDDFGTVLEFGGNKEVGPLGGGAFPLGAPIGPGAYPSLTIIRDTLHLPENGCYSIHISDAYGDGMCCDFGAGYYRMYNLDNPNNPVISGGEFDDYARRAFGAGVLSATQEALMPVSLELFPNPATDLLHIAWETSSSLPVQLRIYNGIGQLQHETTESAAMQQWNLNVAQWPQGVYFLYLTQGGQIRTTAFMVGK
ncbi:MAG TPA: hypothetical protein DCF33_03255 [Saprospirales bacterium]|nr:hypothetical protein [Saprospirales bacterium]